MKKELLKLVNRKALKNKIGQKKCISNSNTNPKQNKNNNINRKNKHTNQKWRWKYWYTHGQHDIQDEDIQEM